MPAFDNANPQQLSEWICELPTELNDRERDQLMLAIETVNGTTTQEGVSTRDWAGDETPLAVGLEIVHILAELRQGGDALVAAMLYRAVREQRLSLDVVQKSFGTGVCGLLDGVLRMAAVSELRGDSDAPVLGQSSSPNTNVRQMLVAMVDDVRVALLKLAERTVAMRVLRTALPEQRIPIAQEVYDVYAPLAHRLGIGHLKWELEDFAFRYLHEDAYRRIARLLDGRRKDRDRFIERVSAELGLSLDRAGVDYELSGRAKHIYSIWRKMQRKGIGFSQVYDIRALRILVDSTKDCYHTLGIVHSIWRNIPNEFDDYVASPKENGYRSLHTAVIGPEGKILEVQIRTHQMHEEAELGVCAHWRYKGSDRSKKQSNTYEQKLAWLRRVLEWHESVGDDETTAQQFSFESTQDRVYVFTPKGDVVSLMQGATPLDFAYHVHTEVGHRCRGAKVNGKIVPLTYRLLTGERVEILTGNESRPRRDWLQTGSEFLITPRARSSVQQWFKAQNRDDNIAAGRALVERECSRLALTSINYREMAKQLGRPRVDDLFAAVGSGDISSEQLLRAAQSVVGDTPQNPLKVVAPSQHLHSDAIQVDGVGNMLTQFARCCMPVPGDEIVGYITRSRGVSVHRRDCNRVLSLKQNTPERIIAVSWGGLDDQRFEVEIAIEAYDRQGLLADVTGLMARNRVNVTEVNTLSDRADNTARMRLRLEVASLESLSSVLNKLGQLDNIVSANRVLD
ncbi:GTP pyrophosphokinase [Luminiphilus syltensis NOR5-1B]|uniref:GTP pyrophosphokinase n=1 Tax=Luminiphilus syltensis NOR5-1B TaxID=565045 RepID=B8KRH3_9GAMM|nr:GTP pyrophosphokinase [Luminiphilus syltensis NOR5-1B]